MCTSFGVGARGYDLNLEEKELYTVFTCLRDVMCWLKQQQLDRCVCAHASNRRELLVENQG